MGQHCCNVMVGHLTFKTCSQKRNGKAAGRVLLLVVHQPVRSPVDCILDSSLSSAKVFDKPSCLLLLQFSICKIETETPLYGYCEEDLSTGEASAYGIND